MAAWDAFMALNEQLVNAPFWRQPCNYREWLQLTTAYQAAGLRGRDVSSALGQQQAFCMVFAPNCTKSHPLMQGKGDAGLILKEPALKQRWESEPNNKGTSVGAGRAYPLPSAIQVYFPLQQLRGYI